MSKLEPFPNQIWIRNGAFLILPPMAITFGLWGLLPDAYSPALFNQGIPTWLTFVENIFRIFVFAVPAFLYFGKSEKCQQTGWVLYFGGVLVYLFSYLTQIYLPMSGWSQSLVGFTAPAWTTLIWFVGIGLVCTQTWLAIPWRRRYYFFGVAIFLGLHVAHVTVVYFYVLR